MNEREKNESMELIILGANILISRCFKNFLRYRIGEVVRVLEIPLVLLQ